MVQLRLRHGLDGTRSGIFVGLGHAQNVGMMELPDERAGVSDPAGQPGRLVGMMGAARRSVVLLAWKGRSERRRGPFTGAGRDVRIGHVLRASIPLLAALVLASQNAAAQVGGTLLVHVRSRSGPVAQAEVRVDGITALTDAKGEAVLALAVGTFELTVSRFGLEPATRRVTIPPAATAQVTIDLEEQAVLTEEVIVSATRTNQRVQDLPLRVEVVPQEEIDEKLFMTPGDISMMLTETDGPPCPGDVAVARCGQREDSRTPKALYAAARRRASTLWPGRLHRRPSDSAHGSRPGGSDQGRGIRAVRRICSWRRDQSGVPSTGKPAGPSGNCSSTGRLSAAPTPWDGCRRSLAIAGATRCSAAATGRTAPTSTPTGGRTFRATGAGPLGRGVVWEDGTRSLLFVTAGAG